MATMLNGPFPAPSIGTARGNNKVYYDADTDVAVAVAADINEDAGWAYKPVNGSLKLNVANGTVGADW
jgi:hypothetical protein